MKNNKLLIVTFTLVSSMIFGQVGINTSTPQATLDVVAKVPTGSAANVDGILVPRIDRQRAQSMSSVPVSTLVYVNNIGTGTATGTTVNIDKVGFYYFENGIWQKMQPINGPSDLTSAGTVIYTNGRTIVAQEITALMSDDFSITATSAPTVGSYIGNLNVEIIDNENSYTSTATWNNFRVKENGVYSIIMNLQLTDTKASVGSLGPVIGLWDDVSNQWVARVNDGYPTAGRLQTYTLITSINLRNDRTYSFRASPHFNNGTETLTIKAINTGSTGSGPISQVSVRRLK
ncbi:hypothetical protein MP478_09020 [Chryseobacterium sp. WG14]|uniref:hypothetical protein n=1 Tax=Chryseobacterium sp. WG14 TaxID=2926909 RepID=UPI00211F4139|nr:hypothetical protein [Chryseobacterium sp. WG14]MCQ9639531.1 hypothetical protein [Chryseobacterium sp. WG14]